jgi:hypothetical protein
LEGRPSRDPQVHASWPGACLRSGDHAGEEDLEAWDLEHNESKEIHSRRVKIHVKYKKRYSKVLVENVYKNKSRSFLLDV